MSGDGGSHIAETSGTAIDKEDACQCGMLTVCARLHSREQSVVSVIANRMAKILCYSRAESLQRRRIGSASGLERHQLPSDIACDRRSCGCHTIGTYS